MAPRKFFRKFTIHPTELSRYKSLQIFGKLIHHPNLFHINRNSTAGAFSVGFFYAFMPVPFQMPLAAATALLFRVNLPLSMLLVWVSNPLTWVPFFYTAYEVGVYILDVPRVDFHFEMSWEWLADGLERVWRPFLLGCFICGAIFAVIGNVSIRILWRLWVVRSWQARKKRSTNKKVSK